MSKKSAILSLGAFDAEGEGVNAVIETPQGSRYKYKFDEETGLFKLGGVLPLGASFPFDFGFIPATLGGDGDPLDVLILMDAPAFAGCLVAARLLGVIEAEQTEAGQTNRNDRLIAVAAESRTHCDVRELGHLNPQLLDEIEHFFRFYNEVRGKQFKPLGRFGTERALKLVKEGVKLHRKARGAKKRRKA